MEHVGPSPLAAPVASLPSRLLPWAALAAIYLLWGSSFMAIRVVVQHVPPFLMASWRYLVAAAILGVIALIVERPSAPAVRELVRFGITGTAMFLGGNGLLSFGELHVPSGMAAVLIATIPFWMVAFEIVRGRLIPSLAIAAGLVCGIVGVVVLVGPATRGDTDLLSAGAILLAAACWAVGSLSARQVESAHGPLTIATLQMAAGGLSLFAAAIVTGEISGFDATMVPGEAWLALAWLVVPAGVVTFGSYTYGLRVLPSNVVATYPFANAVVAVMLGWAFLAEPVTGSTLIGCVVVIASAGLIGSRSAQVRRSPTPG